jgi:diadenosine tetraphosphate (Ap4A) HIT family hydrolase
MATIFTRIANGEIPSYKCAENEDFYAFLDIAPMAKGHTLVIPKKVEDDYIFHLDEATYAGLWAFARKVATALKAAVQEINEGRAALYRQAAAKNGVTVEAAGASAYSSVVQLRLKPGEFYKPANGAWVRK